jgi:mono/diheme cytochrome c family protein
MPDTIGIGRMILAIVALFAVIVITEVFFPAIEVGQQDPSLRAVTSGDLEGLADGSASPQAITALADLGVSADDVHSGWEIYRNEGCVQCHTQQVRAVVSDVGLGPVVTPNDVALTKFDLSGHLRVGPDLSSVGARLSTAELVTVTRNASSRHAWTTMPAYDYLSDDEINDLVAYLATLR